MVRESRSSRRNERQTPQRSSNRRHRRYREALPCTDYYEHFPEDIGPLGNVEISNGRELQSWLLVARPVSRAEAEAKGGCIKFTPLHVDPLHGAGVEPQYFSITDPDDVVYGRAQYISAASFGNEVVRPTSRSCEDNARIRAGDCVKATALAKSDASCCSHSCKEGDCETESKDGTNSNG